MTDIAAPWWQGRRGEWYVVLQAALLALVLLGPFTLGPGGVWPESIASRLRALGILLIGAGLVLAMAGVVELRRNLSPLPEPKSTGALVTTGAYRLARHPIYGGLTLISLGWSFTFGGWATLISAAALFVLLERKSAREEHLLLARFPDYEAYRRRTRRFLPFVY